LERRIERLERDLEQERGLVQRVAVIEAENRDLRARLNLTSRNSSKPPSSDPPSAPSRPSTPPTGRKQGGQPGHPGAKRDAFPPEEVDERVVVRPDRCAKCHKVLGASAVAVGDPDLQQVVEIPPSVAHVTEYVIESLRCPCCESVTPGSLPADVTGVVGPRLQAALTVLTGQFRLSRREATDALPVLFGPKARISTGWVSELEDRTGLALASAHEEAHRAVQSASVLHADETSFPQKNKKGWLWTASTGTVAYFLHHESRGRRAAEKLLGSFRGVLVSDRWVSYHHHKKQMRQVCMAHLKRNFQELVDRGKPAEEVGSAGLIAIAAIFDLWREFEEGRVPFRSLKKRTRPTRMALLAALAKGVHSADRKAAAMSKDLLKLFPCLWTFARYEGIPLTNNLAERRVRPAVLWRKGCFGTQSARGSRFVERILTTVQTLKLQGRCVLDYIEHAVRAQRTGAPAPRLLPG
jgi:transposase